MIRKRGYQNKKNIVVTGGAGFIGSNLVPSLVANGHNVMVNDFIYGKNIFGDTFEDQVKKSDIVYHLAAITSVSHSFKNPEQVYMTNVMGTARVAYLCQKYHKKLIYPSSAAVYHPELSPYADSKRMAEEIVHTLIPGTPTVILRLYNIFGPGMNPNSGSIMYNFLHNKEILVYGDGEQTRDYVHVRDVVSIMEAAMSPSWDGATVEVGTGESYSVNYVASLFAYHRKLKVTYEKPAREIKWSTADITMLRKLYKKKLTTSIDYDIYELCQKHQ